MTDFVDHSFSDKVLFGFSGGPMWNTLQRQLESDRRRRNQKWSLPHHRYSANYTALEGPEKEEILAAFYAMRGSKTAFRFKDFNDYQAVNQPLGVPATASTPIQLSRTYTFGPATYVRRITLPLGVTLAFSGTPFTDFTVDPLTGIATPNTTWPAGAVSWSGEFDVRVCFARDFNPFTRSRPRTSSVTVELEEDFG